MTTTVADRVFIDTNVLVYASRPTAPHHAAARAARRNAPPDLITPPVQSVPTA